MNESRGKLLRLFSPHPQPPEMLRDRLSPKERGVSSTRFQYVAEL